MHPLGLRALHVLLLAFFLLVPAFAQDAPAKSPIRFRVKLADGTVPAAVSGRLLVFMTSKPGAGASVGTEFIPGSTFVAAMEVPALTPGGTVELNPDVIAYPKPFSQAGTATYRVMALLDANHDYNYSGEGEGDIKSAVETREALDPAGCGVVDLTLSKVIPRRPLQPDTDTIKCIEFQSAALTAFWGRPIFMRAVVALPADGATGGSVPTVFHIEGFGAGVAAMGGMARGTQAQMKKGAIPSMVHVFLDPSCPGGHHVFADSVNNGPWGRALTTEFIPHLEKTFGLVAKPHARFLTGHSSGGWSTLWLQVTYPDFFGGTWSTAPDPVDLRNFTGINATPGSQDNAYRDADGKLKPLVRGPNGTWAASLSDFARQEAVIGEYGGQLSSFDWVWSPRGPDGRPLPMFNRATGVLDPTVLEAWQRYDIRLTLEKNWATLGPKLAGKLHLFCGSEDTFRLNESFVLLQKFLKEKDSAIVCELIEGRNHFDLHRPHPSYPEGLRARAFQEMLAKFQAGNAPASQ